MDVSMVCTLWRDLSGTVVLVWNTLSHEMFAFAFFLIFADIFSLQKRHNIRRFICQYDTLAVTALES